MRVPTQLMGLSKKKSQIYDNFPKVVGILRMEPDHMEVKRSHKHSEIAFQGTRILRRKPPNGWQQAEKLTHLGHIPEGLTGSGSLQFSASCLL